MRGLGGPVVERGDDKLVLLLQMSTEKFYLRLSNLASNLLPQFLFIIVTSIFECGGLIFDNPIMFHN